jgi:hypothetical protein
VVDGAAQLDERGVASLGQAAPDRVEQLGDHRLGEPAQHDPSPPLTPPGTGAAAVGFQLRPALCAPGGVVGCAQMVAGVGGQAPAGDDRADPDARAGHGRGERVVPAQVGIHALAPDHPEVVTAQAQPPRRCRPGGAGDPADQAQAFARAAPRRQSPGAEGGQVAGAVGVAALGAPAAQAFRAPGLAGAALHGADGVADQAVGGVGGPHPNGGIPPRGNQSRQVKGGAEAIQGSAGAGSAGERMRHGG